MGWRTRGRARAEWQSNQHTKQWGDTVTNVAAVQHATQAREVQASGRAGAQRGVRGEVVSHDGTPACAYKGQGCVSGAVVTWTRGLYGSGRGMPGFRTRT